MAGTIRNTTSRPGRPALVKSSYASATAYPCGISRDSATVYGAFAGAADSTASGKLYETTDDGTTWTEIEAFGAGNNVLGLLELADGEALVTTSPAAEGGKLWKSTGWASGHAAATWTQVLSVAGYIRQQWSLHQWSFGDEEITAGSGAIGVVNEYGTKYDGSNASVAATSVYLTTDHGETWSEILDLHELFPATTELHVHASAYDTRWDRIWVTFGDPSPVPGTGTELLYSDDRGETWTQVDADDRYHSTTIMLLDDCILLGSDSNPGLTRIARTGYREIGSPQYVSVIQPHNSGDLICMGAYWSGRTGDPLLIGFINETGPNLVPQIIGTVDGREFFEYWRDDSLVGGEQYNGPLHVFGPTTNGKYLARVRAGSGETYKQLVADIQPTTPRSPLKRQSTGLTIMDGLPPVSPSSAPNRVLSSGVLAMNVRMPLELPEDIESICVLFGNWYVMDDGFKVEDTNGSHTITKLSASVESQGGTITQLITNATVAPGQNLITPEQKVTLLASETNYLRMYVEVASTSAAFPLSFVPLSTEYRTYTSSPSDLTGSSGAISGATTTGTLGSSANFQAFGPQLVCGRSKNRHPRVITAIGESTNGVWDTDPSRGFIPRALSPKGISAARMHRGGDSLADLGIPFRWRMRKKLMEGATDAIVMTGLQELTSTTLVEMKANFAILCTELRNAGLRISACTLHPYTGLNGTQEGYRTGFNDWLRAGANGLIDECVETADSVETSRNSGSWTSGMPYSGNAAPDVDGHTAMATVLAASTVAATYATAASA